MVFSWNEEIISLAFCQNSDNFPRLKAQEIIGILTKCAWNCFLISLVAIWLHVLILLPEKFLQFDWLRADVFQLNLKYLHVKITVTMVTPNHHIISSHELRKNGGKISRFWNQEIPELNENSEDQNTTKKYIDLAQCLDKLGRKQELRKQFARLRGETTRRK